MHLNRAIKTHVGLTPHILNLSTRWFPY